MPFSPQPSGGVSAPLVAVELRTEELRRAERVDAAESVAVGADAAPFVGGGEGDLGGHRVFLAGARVGQRFARLRPGRGAAGEDPQHRPHLGFLGIIDRLHLGQPHLVRGQRAGLVHAEDVDVGEGLDRVRPLHQRVLVRQTDGAHRVGDDDHQEEPRGHDAEHHRRRQHRLFDRVAPDQRAEQHGDEEECRDHQQQPHDQVDLCLERRERNAIGAGPRGHLRRGVGGPDPLGLIPARSRDAEAPGGDGIAGMLRHRVGLAGQQRLVHLHRAVADDRAVGKDLISGADAQHIAAHDLLRIE